MQNVCLKSRTRDVCGRFVVAVSFADGNVCAMEEGWKQQWFYSIMASSFGLHFDGLDATGTVRASSEMQ